MAQPPLAEQGTAGSDADVVRLAARAFEHDRYLAALLAPPAVRDDLLALAAFAGELARIPGYVSEPMLGEIRLQWWRGAVDGLATGAGIATGHPVGNALGRTMRRHRLPVAALHDLIDAQAARLDDLPFQDLTALKDNLARWDGTLFRLAWRILAPPEAAPERTLAPPLLAVAAEAYGLARLLNELPAELAQGRCRIPRELMAEHGLSLAPPGNAAIPQRWHRVTAELSSQAVAALAAAAAGYQVAPRPVRCAALPIALVRPYLRACEGIDRTACDVRDIGPLTRVWRLWLAHRTGWI